MIQRRKNDHWKLHTTCWTKRKKKKKKKGDTNIRIFFKCIKVVTIFPASNHNDYALRRGTLQREIKFLTNSITSRAMHAATETFQPREKRIFFFFFSAGHNFTKRAGSTSCHRRLNVAKFIIVLREEFFVITFEKNWTIFKNFFFFFLYILSDFKIIKQ